MPRRRTQYRRKTDAIPDAFPQRQHASGLPWAEIARRLGVAPLTIRRWRYKGVIRRELIHVDTGMMALTTKHLYFAGRTSNRTRTPRSFPSDRTKTAWGCSATPGLRGLKSTCWARAGSPTTWQEI